MEYNYHQEALLEFGTTLELSRITGLSPEEVLDIILPSWRSIREREYAEGITWVQAFKLQDELVKVKKAMGKE